MVPVLGDRGGHRHLGIEAGPAASVGDPATRCPIRGCAASASARSSGPSSRIARSPAVSSSPRQQGAAGAGERAGVHDRPAGDDAVGRAPGQAAVTLENLADLGGRQAVGPPQPQLGPPLAAERPVQPHPGHAAVGEDVEPDGVDVAGVGDADDVPGVRLQPGLRQQLGPGGGVDRPAAAPAGAAERGPAGRVAHEPAGVELGQPAPAGTREGDSTQSLPASRRRAVSQPSPISRASPGMIRFVREARSGRRVKSCPGAAPAPGPGTATPGCSWTWLVIVTLLPGSTGGPAVGHRPAPRRLSRTRAARCCGRLRPAAGPRTG